MKGWTLKRLDGSLIAHRVARNRRAFVEGLARDGIDLSDADMAGWNMPGLTLPAGTILRGASFAGGHIPYAKMPGCDLDRVNLSKANANGIHLRRSTIRSAILFGMKGRGANLELCTLIEAILDEADLTAASASTAIFDGCSIVRTVLRDLHGHGASFRRTWMVEADLRKGRFLPPPDRRGSDDPSRRFADAHAIACLYDQEETEAGGVPVFETDRKRVDRVRHGTWIAASATAGIVVERAGEALRQIEHWMPGHGFAVPAVVAGVSVFSVSLLLDLLKERTTERAVGLSERVANAISRAALALEGYGRDRRHLVALCASRRSLRPLRLALLAGRAAWRTRQETGSTIKRCWQGWLSLAIPSGRILVCDRRLLAQAMGILQRARARDGYPRQDMVLLRPGAQEGDRAPAALSIGHLGTLKAVWIMPGGHCTVYYPLNGQVRVEAFPVTPGQDVPDPPLFGQGVTAVLDLFTQAVQEEAEPPRPRDPVAAAHLPLAVPRFAA